MESVDRRLLVTGGAGFIGSHVVEAALADGWTVAVLDDLSSGRRAHVPSGVAFYEIDVRDAGGVQAAVRDFSPTVISHQAAQASVSVSVRDPLLDAEINIRGGLHILEAARTNKVHRIVFASTGGAIYGEVSSGAADECTPERPYSPYATSKFAFERYMETYRQQYGLQAISLRYANVYGPRQNPHGEAGVVAIFLQHLRKGEPLQINARQTLGDDGCLRDYVYVADVARANLAAARGDTPALLNVGTGQSTSTRALAEALAKEVGVTPILTSALPRPGDLKRSVLDSTLASSLLGTPTSLDAGLRQLVLWSELEDAAQTNF
ncbi:NAD-dependent epimerase/dehydratase family protein [Deinococcus hohokamensis]|uniref:NAD-dependent epimerase/dehydratase family protein n=1 Tax=Deinococcus hohokamensis TaxID=309883 RepID=A0ABV9ICT1_9DEIO